MKKMYSIVSLITLFLISSVKAEVYQDVCEGCTTSSEYRAVVKQLIDYHRIKSLPQKVYVFNYTNGVLKKYNASSELLDVRSNDKIYIIDSINPTSAESQNFALSVSKLQTLKTSLRSTVIPETVVDSAYSMVKASYKENDLADHFNANKSLSDQLNGLIASAVSVTGKLPNLKPTFEVAFSDGSSAVLQLIGLTENGTFRLKFISGKDVDNNTITNDPNHYASGGFRFTVQGQEGINKFLTAAARAGIPIYYGGSGGTTSGTSMTCSTVGKDLICEVTRDAS